MNSILLTHIRLLERSFLYDICFLFRFFSLDIPATFFHSAILHDDYFTSVYDIDSTYLLGYLVLVRRWRDYMMTQRVEDVCGI